MIAKKFFITKGFGKSYKHLPSFDKALFAAGIGNYNLVRLSSILPAHCVQVDHVDLKEGSLLPTAYSTISSDKKGDILISTIGVGLPKDENNVGVIMEFSCLNKTEQEAKEILFSMIEEAFHIRGWDIKDIIWTSQKAIVSDDGVMTTTFAAIAEWEDALGRTPKHFK